MGPDDDLHALLAAKGVEYGTKLDAGFTRATNDFFLYLFVLAGIHLLHVVFDAGVVRRAAGRPVRGPQDISFIEAGASYWHMVDLLWIVPFPPLDFMR